VYSETIKTSSIAKLARRLTPLEVALSRSAFGPTYSPSRPTSRPMAAALSFSFRKMMSTGKVSCC